VLGNGTPNENVLKSYIKRSEPIYTFENVLNRHLKNKTIQHHYNEWIKRRLKEIDRSIKKTFHIIIDQLIDYLGRRIIAELH
jgi:hypothetical protein